MPDIVNYPHYLDNQSSEGIMPVNHVKYNGKLYFLNKETMKVTVYRYETIDLKECPEPALRELMKMQAGVTVDLDGDRVEADG
jgi:hypothetical protein